MSFFRNPTKDLKKVLSVAPHKAGPHTLMGSSGGNKKGVAPPAAAPMGSGRAAPSMSGAGAARVAQGPKKIAPTMAEGGAVKKPKAKGKK